MIYSTYSGSTMCSPEAFSMNIELAQHVAMLPGHIVECGTWRGGMIAAIAKTLGPARNYVLCDSFQGLPPAQAIDGPDALAWQRISRHNCRATADEARESMRFAGITSYQVVEGWFCDTLPLLNLEKIALLRLDADWYESTLCCLDNLWEAVVPGGIVILDDYYVWDGCARAVHEFLSFHSLPDRVRQRGDVAYIEKGRRC